MPVPGAPPSPWSPADLVERSDITITMAAAPALMVHTCGNRSFWSTEDLTSLGKRRFL